jgi:hypothetical protein
VGKRVERTLEGEPRAHPERQRRRRQLSGASVLFEPVGDDGFLAAAHGH